MHTLTVCIIALFVAFSHAENQAQTGGDTTVVNQTQICATAMAGVCACACPWRGACARLPPAYCSVCKLQKDRSQCSQTNLFVCLWKIGFCSVSLCYVILFLFSFYFILFYFILFHVMLFCFVLFCFVLFYFILFYFVLFYLCAWLLALTRCRTARFNIVPLTHTTVRSF